MHPFLNYHHLRYFRAVALEGNLTRAAAGLNLTPPALSIQLKHLEESLGQPLFDRKGKKLLLTEAGRIALEYAENIFRSGEELSQTLRGRSSHHRSVLRIGAVATLSRNFQLQVLHPLADRTDVELVVRSGSLRDLLPALSNHTVDLILSNLPVARDAENRWHSHLLHEERVSLVGKPRLKGKRFRFPEDLRSTPILLPSLESHMRASFDRLMETMGIKPQIAAEVDDMAMLRLLAKSSNGISLVPPVVVQEELMSKTLVELHRFSNLTESFYAITPERRFPNPLVAEIVRQFQKPRRKGKS